jgi:hypothetical protein
VRTGKDSTPVCLKVLFVGSPEITEEIHVTPVGLTTLRFEQDVSNTNLTAFLMRHISRKLTVA